MIWNLFSKNETLLWYVLYIFVDKEKIKTNTKNQ